MSTRRPIALGLGAAAALAFSALVATTAPRRAAAQAAPGPGEALYRTSCAQCHGEDRLGQLAPPLLPQTLAHYTRAQLKTVITRGVAGTRMQGLDMPDATAEALVDLILEPKEARWTAEQIASSRAAQPVGDAPAVVPDIDDVTAIVERGPGNVLFVHGRESVGQLFFPNVHGGLKFRGRKLYVPSRTGFILRCDLPTLKADISVRAGIYLRNIEITDRYVVAACSMPPRLAFFDHELNLQKVIPLEDEPSSVIRYDAERFLVTFTRAPRLVLLDDAFASREVAVAAPYQQAAVVDGLVIGTNGKKIFATDLARESVIEDDAIPHVAAGDFWRDGDTILWATPKIKSSGVTVYRIRRGAAGFSMERVAWVEAKAMAVRGHSNTFVRTHPALDFLVTTAGHEVLIVSKSDFRIVKRLEPAPGRMPLHTEFSKDGSTLFVSVYHENGGIHLYSTADFSVQRVIPAAKPAGQYNRTMKTTRIVRSGG